MSRTITCLALLLAAAVAAEPPALVLGPDVSVAVEPGSGRVAVIDGATASVFAAAGEAQPLTSFELPNQTARMLDFQGDMLVFSFATPGVAEPQFFAVTVEGRERLLYPNEGVGQYFPAAGARLTRDGRGLVDELTLTEPIRRELEIPGSVPVGAGVVVTYRFSNERMLIRFSEAFDQAIGLSTADLLVTKRGGGMLRYRSPDGMLWERHDDDGPWRLLDVDPGQGLAAVGVGREVRLIAIEDGATIGAWKGGFADARLLPARRLLVLADGNLQVVEPAGGRVIAEDLLSGALARHWEKESGLEQAFPLPSGRLLLRGPEGWYLLALP